MKQLDQKFIDSRIERAITDAHVGVRAPSGGRARLVNSAGIASSETWSRKLRPDWLSASVARQLREKRRSTDQAKYSHLVLGLNLRFAW
jgi:hypothetical protein